MFDSRIAVALPLIQAPMAGAQDRRLAQAVADAGGLGSLPCAMLDPAALADALAWSAAQPRPINLNFFCHPLPAADADRERRWRAALQPYYDEAGVGAPAPSAAGLRRPLDAATVALLEAHPPAVVSFHFGLPEAALLARIRALGTCVLATATSVDEGRWLAARGVDAVIAQGHEAGGHRGDFLAPAAAAATTRDLVAQLVNALELPIVAAGGIGTRADVVALMAAGAAAVQAGTAYLRCPEATTSPVHRAALRDAGTATALTNLFSGRPARGLVNRLMRELGPLSPLAPEFPYATAALAPLRAHAEAQGRGDFSPLWAGTAFAAGRDADAATITRALAGVD